MHPRRSPLIAVFVLAVAYFASATFSALHAAVDIYARFADGKGVWAGGATDPNHIGWVQLTTISFGESNSITLSGGGGGSGKASFSTITLGKLVDALSPQIFQSIVTGSRVTPPGPSGDVTIEFVKTVGTKQVTFFRLDFKLVYLSSSSTTAGAGDESVSETVTLLAGVMRVTYWPQNPDGSLGTPVNQAWNLTTNSNGF